MLDLLAEMAGQGFYGNIKIKIVDGVITHVNKGQKIRLEKKLTGTNYSGTISLEYENSHIVDASRIEQIDVKH